MLRIVLFAALFLLGGRAAAQDVFTVAEVPVFAEAESAAEAQALAREQGRRRALDLLFRRLVAEEDWVYLPNLVAGTEATGGQDDLYDLYSDEGFAADPRRPISIPPEQLDDLEQETTPYNEKSSATSYRARITYRFKPKAIRDILRSARLPYSEEQAREVLILPVLLTENGTYLWEAKNPWARAWLERPLANELTPFLLPRGDTIDVQAITAEEAKELNAASLRAFAERYGQGQIYLALGRLTEENDQFRFFVQLINATPPALTSGEAQPSAIGEQVVDLFFRGPDDDFPALARRAVESTVQRHANSWKRRTLVDYGLEREFQLTAWFDGQRALAHIQDALGKTALTLNWSTEAFNSRNAIMQLTVVGSEEQFELAMRERDLVVWQDDTRRWHIAETELASELQARGGALTTDIDQEATQRRGIGRFFRRGRDRDSELEEVEMDPIGTEDEGEGGDDVPDLPDDLFGDGGDGR
jgi:hypothetical protein